MSGPFRQTCCAHCYKTLLPHRQLASEILCDDCEASWREQAEAVLSQFRPVFRRPEPGSKTRPPE